MDYAKGHPVATVEFDDPPGLRFTATLVDCERPQMKLGLPVELTWIEREGRPDEDQMPDLRQQGQQVVAANLWRVSELTREDCDIFFPYDGFTVIALSWFEVMGYCGYGEAGPFLEDNWNADEQRVEIAGRIPVNPHAGSLSDGGTQGVGHVREAVLQLREEAADRQVPGARTALLTPGGFLFNAGGLILRTE